MAEITAELLGVSSRGDFRAQLLRMDDNVWAEVNGPFSPGWTSLRAEQLYDLSVVLDELRIIMITANMLKGYVVIKNG
jgi:hypothetical protein